MKVVIVLKFIAAVISVTVPAIATNKTKDLYLLGLFPFTGGWNGGEAYLQAATMAMEHINSRGDLLPEHRLSMAYNNSRVG